MPWLKAASHLFSDCCVLPPTSPLYADAFVASDRETGRSRGFGFVTLPTDAAKTAAAETDGTEFMGR